MHPVVMLKDAFPISEAVSMKAKEMAQVETGLEDSSLW